VFCYHIPVAMHLFFSFYRSRDPRDLHSFPTRRSSDLPHRLEGTRRGTLLPVDGRQSRRNRPPPSPRHREPEGHRNRRRCARHRRSEEHTFELQSRENLVCRLLLEKKKKKKHKQKIDER